jgi:hypothetical protein
LTASCCSTWDFLSPLPRTLKPTQQYVTDPHTNDTSHQARNCEMRKRPEKVSSKTAAQEEFQDAMDKIVSEIGNGFENVTIVDRAPWIDDADATKNRAWYVALEKLDKNNDPTRMVDLLRSSQELDASIRFHLADLIVRRAVKGKRGAPLTPSYDRTRAEALLFCALDDARDLAKIKEVSVLSLLDEMAERYRVDCVALRQLHAGKRTSSRRMAARRKRK